MTSSCNGTFCLVLRTMWERSQQKAKTYETYFLSVAEHGQQENALRYCWYGLIALLPFSLQCRQMSVKSYQVHLQANMKGNTKPSYPLQRRHNERDGVSNYRSLDYLLKRLFRRRSKKTSKLHVAGLCEGNSQMTGEILAQRASNAEMFPLDDVIMPWLFVKGITGGRGVPLMKV